MLAEVRPGGRTRRLGRALSTLMLMHFRSRSVLAQRLIRVHAFRYKRRSGRRPVFVYSALIGETDEVRAPTEFDESATFILFTDGEAKAPHPWITVRVPSYFRDPKVSVGYLKANPHLLFPWDSRVVWVDANLHELRLPAGLVEGLLSNGAVAVMPHPVRGSVLSEAEQVVEQGLDSESRVRRLLLRFADVGFNYSAAPLYCGGFIVRDLGDPRVRRFCKYWWRGIVEGSRRDQLTLSYGLWAAGLKPAVVPVDIQRPNLIFTRRPHLASHQRTIPAHSDGPVEAPWLTGWNVAASDEHLGSRTTPIHSDEDWDERCLSVMRALKGPTELAEPILDYSSGSFEKSCTQWTPPDIRGSWRRQFIRNAVIGCERVLQIGIAEGQEAAIMLSVNPLLHITCVQPSLSPHADAVASLIKRYFGDRLCLQQGELGRGERFRDAAHLADLVYIPHSVSVGGLAAILKAVIAQGLKGLLILVDVFSDGKAELLWADSVTPSLKEVCPGLLPNHEIRLYQLTSVEGR